MIITIDGPAGAGKSTVARAVARRLGIPCLNSGYIYRAVTLLVIEDGSGFDDAEHVRSLIDAMNLSFRETETGTAVHLNGREVSARLKDPDVTPEIYQIANNGTYRSWLVDLQRRFAEPKGVVAEGRDMGTVIFPDADFKFYLDASAEERARRQHIELVEKGRDVSFEDVLEGVRVRDNHDRQREQAPLTIPQDAVVIESDGLSAAGVIEKVLRCVETSAA